MRNETMSEHQIRVAQFMARAGQDLPETPAVPSIGVRLLRAKLILEECLETIEALGFTPILGQGLTPIDMGSITFKPDLVPNLVEIADGCADISVVTIGTLLACGIGDLPLLREVDRSNLDKFRGDAHRGENGKWCKPSDWVKPDIEGVLKIA